MRIKFENSDQKPAEPIQQAIDWDVLLACIDNAKTVSDLKPILQTLVKELRK